MEQTLSNKGVDSNFRIVDKVEPPFVWFFSQIENTLHLSPSLGVNLDDLSFEGLDIREMPKTLILQNDRPEFRVDLDRCLEQVTATIKDIKSLQSIKEIVIRDKNGECTGMSRQVVAPEIDNF